jgi:hypothetical protein
MPGPMPRIFLSHSTRDAPLCNWLRSAAAAAGIELYMAEHDVDAGERLAERIRSAIKESAAVVVLISEVALDSSYVNQEIGVALEADKVIIPLVQPGVDVSRLAMIGDLKYIPFDFERPHEGRDALLATLRRLIERQQQARGIPAEAVVLAGLALAVLLLLAADPAAPAMG